MTGIILTQHVIYGLTVKNESTTFNADIMYNYNFKSLDYKAKLLGSKVAQTTPHWASRIIKNITNVVPLRWIAWLI